MTGPPVPAEVQRALAALTPHRPLLIGLDFDGALAPIVRHPQDARALPGTLDAVATLSAARDVTVALVSGRSRADLVALTGLPDDGPVLLVGSHGAEFGSALGTTSGLPATHLLDDAGRARLARVRALLAAVAADHPGAHLELKPTAAVLHTRPLSAAAAAAASERAVQALDGVTGVQVMLGKQVVEASVLDATKGAAVAALRHALGARAVLYIGDDVTDETVFATLTTPDVGVKVGPGATAAGCRVADPSAVRALLQHLVRLLPAAA